MSYQLFAPTFGEVGFPMLGSLNSAVKLECESPNKEIEQQNTSIKLDFHPCISLVASEIFVAKIGKINLPQIFDQ